VVKTVIGLHAGIKLVFPGMAEGGMAKIVAKGEGLGEVFVEPERSGNRAGDLGDFQRMGQPCAEMIALMSHKNLGFLLQAPKSCRVDYAVPVTLERRAGRRRRLFEEASAAVFVPGCEQGSLFHRGFSPYVLHMTDVSTPDVTLTASAAKRINAILAKQDGAAFLRVSVEGGGCSGFSYKFDFAPQANADDLVIERDGARVLIDEMSLGFLRGSEIDFANELIGAAFRIRNPNATSGCGCGTSFSV
jgi:iron-sulfur cluster assembly protein